MATRNSLLRFARLLHLYLGVFVAPALLFFSFTGGLQTFNLYETTRGSNYVPPRWAVVLGQIHKKQTAIVPVRRPVPPEAAPGSPPDPTSRPERSRPAPAPDPASNTHHPLPLKIFVGLASLFLIVSTATGVYMAYRYERNVRLITVLLVAGTLLPIILIFV